MDFDQKSVNVFSNEACDLTHREHDDEWLPLEILLRGVEDLGGLVVRSAAMRRVVKTLERLGPYREATVLIYGESGTGKELAARLLHTLGPTPKGPFVTFNCSNLMETLAESQLFGHVRGAFTDAREDALGYFRSANGGTLFLDEIGELPLRLQPKLLRAVESHEVQPVGAAHSYKVDIRLIAATNRDLRAMVKAGEFRDDLYYRLSASAVAIPPLRERRDALEALTGHFLEHYNRLFGKRIRYISRRALAALRAYDWPGNVREFAHAMQSAAMLTDNDRIDVSALRERLPRTNPEALAARTVAAPDLMPANLSISTDAASHKSASAVTGGPLLLDEVIKRTLMRSLEETEGNRRRAADLLGVSRSTLYRMLARYGLAETRDRRGMAARSGVEGSIRSG